MKLFLASTALSANYLKEIISPTQHKVILIPTAATPYSDKWFVEEDRQKLTELGFSVEDYDIEGKTKKQLWEKLSKAEIIFVSGGNSFYLLEKMKESGFDKIIRKLLENGIIYVGESAGAVIAGPSIEPIKLLDNPSKAPKLKSFKALNLIDFIPLPHADSQKYGPKCKEAILQFGSKFKMTPIGDRQAIIVDGKFVKIVG